MSNNDRDRRLLDASVLNGAIDSLSKVKDGQRIEFIHDRMMSAIDDICKTQQGAAAKERFTAAQIVILKDIIFHVIYVLDSRNRSTRGFFGRLIEDFRAQSPLKQVTIGFAVASVIFGAGLSLFSGAKPWLAEASYALNIVERPRTVMNGSQPAGHNILIPESPVRIAPPFAGPGEPPRAVLSPFGAPTKQ